MANFIVFEHNEKRTKNSKTYRMHSGELQTQIFMGDIHYEDEFDNLQNIDTKLIDEADLDEFEFPVYKEAKEQFKAQKELMAVQKKAGKLDREKFDYQALKVPFICKLPKKFSKGYSIGKGQDRLEFIPVKCSPAKGYVNDTDPSTIEYQDPWNDVDVSLQITDRGIKETLTLKTDKAPVKFSFEVRGNLDGELKLQAPWLEDNKGERRDVQQDIRTEGTKTYIDLTADVAGLEFPVKIDPTVTIKPTGTTGKDTYTYGYSAGTNYGSQEDMNLSKGNLMSLWLQYDLSGITGTVTSATLELVITQKGNFNSGSITYAVMMAAASWERLNITHANKPTTNGVYQGAGTISYDQSGTVSTNLTNMVNGWVKGEYTNYGMTVEAYYASNGDAEYGTVKFGTSRYTYGTQYIPRLIVTYVIPPSAPTITTPNGGETWNAQHTITWDTARGINTLDTGYSVASTSTSVNASKMAQVFTTNAVYSKLYSAKCRISNLTGGTQTKIELWSVSSSLPDTLIESKTVPISMGDGIIVTPNFETLLNPNTQYAVVFSKYSSEVYNLGASASNPYANGAYCYYSSPNWWVNASYDIGLELYMYEPASLQYNIQLSTDGVTYPTTIAALTVAGATSLDYDFSAISQTSTAKIRIRAYDGYGYGPWDESNGVFTIQHNTAPTAPTNLAPNGSAQDRAATIRLSWQHNDPNEPDPQSKFDLQYSVNDGGSWTTVTQTTTNQYLDIAGGTFAHGTVLWKVRTYDQADVAGPYSAQASFLAGDKPGTPSITSPADEAIVAVANPTVQWSSSGQTAYQLQAIDSLNATEYDSNEVTSTNKAQTITAYDFANEEAYTLKLRVKNADGIWSDWTSVVVSVSYTPPATPTIELTAEAGYISLTITNPEPTGTEPTVTSCDVYRRKSGESSWTRIATGVTDSYSDYAVASGITYDYKVRAYGDNGTYADSATDSLSITLRGIWLHDVKDPSGTIHQFKYNEGRSAKWQPEVALMQFSGRSSPVSEFEEEVEDSRVNVNLLISKKTSDLAVIESLAYRRSTLCYRDSKGRKVFGIIPQLPVVDQKYGNSVALEIIRTAYLEVV